MLKFYLILQRLFSLKIGWIKSPQQIQNFKRKQVDKFKLLHNFLLVCRLME